MLYYKHGKPKSQAAYPLDFRRGNPPDERKEGDLDECYICGFIPVLYICRCPCWSVLSDLQGKEIAATTANSDGQPIRVVT